MTFLPYGSTSSSGWFGAFGASAVLHGGAVLGVMTLSADALTIKAVPARTAFSVTLDQLDPDTLAGLIEQDGLAGSDGETPTETADPSNASAPPSDTTSAGEQAAALAGATIELPLETPTPNRSETLTAQTAQPDSLAPSPIMADTLSPLDGTETLAPLAAPDMGGVAQSDGLTETITTNLTATNPLSTGTQPQSAAPAPPTEQDLAIGDLIEHIRDAPPQSCTLVLPRRDGSDGIGLALIAAQDTTMEAAAQSILTPQDTDIRQTRTLVDARQCAALRLVQSNAAYPALRLGIQIDSPEITSGGTITGVLRGVGGRYLTLVLVDDNGVVTDLQRFTTLAGNVARFDVPVTRVGLDRDTSPMIIAIATDRPVGALTDQLGRLAQDVFSDTIVDDLTDAHLGLVTVDIR